MIYDKSHLRKKSILKRKKKYFKVNNFNFDLVFNLITDHFKRKKVLIACYYPTNYEVNTLPFIEKAKRKNFKTALPVIKESNKMTFKLWDFEEPLYVSKFGTLEPNKLNKNIIPDIIMVPLVAFDKKLNRIGYGKGFYDRYLQEIKRLKKKTISVGIAFSFQQCRSVPINKYDFKLDYIFTERGIINSEYKL